MKNRNTLNPYCQHKSEMSTQYNPKACKMTFKLGDIILPSLGSIPVRIPPPKKRFLPLRIHIVYANILILMGLEILDREHMVAEMLTTNCTAKHKGRVYELPECSDTCSMTPNQ